MNYTGQVDPSNAANHGAENGTFSQAESVVNPSKKIENDMMLLGKKIKQHEENIKFLRTHKNMLDDEITDKQVTLGKYHSSSAPMIEDGELSHMRSEEATIESIMKHEKTAAALFCQLKRHRNQAAHIKDVLGVVATLGKVNDDNLSWLLSEYLGLDSMLSLVCITYDGIKALVTYDQSGSINKSSGLYGLGTAIGQPLEGRFNVFCLENLRPYVGDFMPNDPQKRLELFKPRLPNGETPSGFLGFAVNMIHIDDTNLFCLTNDGNGLRETLFYKLFSRLQVYETRAEMVQALPCIYDGAVSLDGGMIKGLGVYSLGTREEIGVKFPITSGVSYLPEACVEVEKELKELKWKRERMTEDIQREEALLSHAKYSFEVKKQEFLGFMVQSSPYTMPPSLPKMDPSNVNINDRELEKRHMERRKKRAKIIQVMAEEVPRILGAFQAVAEKIGSGSTSPRPRSKRTHILRDREGANARLMADYFDDPPRYTDAMFRRRFRMSRRLFLRIAEDLEREYECFQQKCDARGYLGFTAIQKCTSAVHILAYGNTTDINTDYLEMAEKTSRDALENFCNGVIQLYGGRYLRNPTSNDLTRIYEVHESKHYFPGMIGSLDCMHWEWGNCPTALRGQYTCGDHGVPTVSLQAICSQDLWVWSAYFGSVGSNNDINVLNASPVPEYYINRSISVLPFHANGTYYRHGYYLTKGIYPEYSIFRENV